MGEKVKEFFEKLKNSWESSDKKKKAIYISSFVLILTLIIFTFFKLTETKYETLYSDLTLADTAEITTKLDELNIPWELSEDETSISVPAEEKHRAKIELANQGLPKDGYSFMDAFDESSWTLTDYDKRQRMKQALQSELALTISDIDGIESAKVYIEERDKSNFVLDDEESKTTASVFVVKKPNEKLEGGKVRTIKNLVAGAINANPEDIIVTDNDGRLLEGDNDTATGDVDQFKVKTEIENKINESIRKFLSNLYGYENVDVLSSVKINMDLEQTKVVEFSPPLEDGEEGLIRSMEEHEEHMVGPGPGGVPGYEENVEDYPLEEDNAERYDKASKIINNELNEINREIRKAPGQVESITVAVLINESSLPEGELTPDREEEITELIYAATGLDTKQVEVIAGEFSSTMGDLEEGDEDRAIWPIVLGVIILLAVIGVAIYLFMKKREEEYEEALLDEAMQEEMGDDFLDEDIDFIQEEPHMKRQINKFIEEQPEAVTQLLRSWLNE